MDTTSQMTELIRSCLAYILCAALIVVYAWDRFNTPPSNRSSTRQGLYWQSCVGYILSALGLFVALSLLLEQADWRVLLSLKAEQNVPAPLLATLAMTTLLPRVPLLSRLDRWLLDLFLDWAAIPAEVKRRAAALIPHGFAVTSSDVAALRAGCDDVYGKRLASHLRDRGVGGLEHSRLRFTRVVKLYAQIQQLAASEPRYSRFFEQNADEFAELGREVEGFIRDAVARLDIGARLHGITGDAAYQELLEERRETFAADCRSRFIMMTRFLARAVLRSEASEADIVTRLRRIGFPEAESMNTPVFPLNSLTALGLGVFAYLATTACLFSQILVTTAGAHGHSPFAIAGKVTLVRVMTLALTVWLIQRYAFFRRNPGEAPRYFAYLVNGTAAAALTLSIGALLHLVDPHPVDGFRTELPLVLLSLMLCTSVAFCCDDWPANSDAPRWLRPAEAVGCGAVMALGMVVIDFAGLGLLDPGGGWRLVAFIALPSALGMIVGACVPHIYRESRRVAAAQREKARTAEPVPAGTTYPPLAANLLAPPDDLRHALLERMAARRRGARAERAVRVGGAG